jgi:small-conductance mechanosensitive channel
VNLSMSSTDEPSTAPAEDEKFYASALSRIRTFMLVLAPLAGAAAWIKFGWPTATGFLLGCIIAYLNFQWLKSGVSALADKVSNTGEQQSGKAIIARFLLRYALLGLAAYAILTSFPASLGGLFAGLFLPVGAIVCEAVYELYTALRPGA